MMQSVCSFALNSLAIVRKEVLRTAAAGKSILRGKVICHRASMSPYGAGARARLGLYHGASKHVGSVDPEGLQENVSNVVMRAAPNVS